MTITAVVHISSVARSISFRYRKEKIQSWSSSGESSSCIVSLHVQRQRRFHVFVSRNGCLFIHSLLDRRHIFTYLMQWHVYRNEEEIRKKRKERKRWIGGSPNAYVSSEWSTSPVQKETKERKSEKEPRREKRTEIERGWCSEDVSRPPMKRIKRRRPKLRNGGLVFALFSFHENRFSCDSTEQPGLIDHEGDRPGSSLVPPRYEQSNDRLILLKWNKSAHNFYAQHNWNRVQNSTTIKEANLELRRVASISGRPSVDQLLDLCSVSQTRPSPGDMVGNVRACNKCGLVFPNLKAPSYSLIPSTSSALVTISRTCLGAQWFNSCDQNWLTSYLSQTSDITRRRLCLLGVNVTWCRRSFASHLTILLIRLQTCPNNWFFE